MTDYKEIRCQLINMLEELDERLGKITDDVKHIEKPVEQDFSELAVQNENNEVLDALGNAARTEVEKIKQALSRIDAGTYGVCISCGEAIKRERLSVLPYANYCMCCAKAKEQK